MGLGHRDDRGIAMCNYQRAGMSVKCQLDENRNQLRDLSALSYSFWEISRLLPYSW